MRIIIKLFFNLITVTLFCFLVVPNIYLKAATDYKIVSMNIHCLKDNWTFRVSKILDEIIKISPSVINFQEVCQNKNENQIDFIRDYLIKGGYPLRTVQTQFSHKAWDVDDEYLATFSKLTTNNIQKGFLPVSPLQRSFIAMQIDGIWIINIHLEHRTDYALYRQRQIQFLIEKFKNSPHLIIGDFNSSPICSEQNDLHQNNYRPYFPGITHRGDNSQNIYDIDGVWISSQLQCRLKMAEAHIFLKEPIDGNYLSDHFAILFNFNFNRLYKDCALKYTETAGEKYLPQDLPLL